MSISNINSQQGEPSREVDRVRFHRDGFLVFPEFLSASYCAEAVRELERLEGRITKTLMASPVFVRLIFAPPLLALVRPILGRDILLHHANGRALRVQPGEIAKKWHHDYDGPAPWIPGAPMMIHALFYPGGVTRDAGHLALVPGSHRRAVERSFPLQYGVSALEGEVAITGAPGLLVLIHSALWHVKKPTIRACARYNFNIGYCQSGIEWSERQRDRHLLSALRQSVNDEASSLLLRDDDAREQEQSPLLWNR